MCQDSHSELVSGSGLESKFSLTPSLVHISTLIQIVIPWENESYHILQSRKHSSFSHFEGTNSPYVSFQVSQMGPISPPAPKSCHVTSLSNQCTPFLGHSDWLSYGHVIQRSPIRVSPGPFDGATGKEPAL